MLPEVVRTFAPSTAASSQNLKAKQWHSSALNTASVCSQNFRETQAHTFAPSTALSTARTSRGHSFVLLLQIQLCQQPELLQATQMHAFPPSSSLNATLGAAGQLNRYNKESSDSPLTLLRWVQLILCITLCSWQHCVPIDKHYSHLKILAGQGVLALLNRPLMWIHHNVVHQCKLAQCNCFFAIPVQNSKCESQLKVMPCW